MTWWIWTLIIIGFAAATTIAGWGLVTSIRFSYKTKYHDWESYFSQSNTQLSPQKLQENESGLAVIVFGKKWTNDDSFLPFLTFAAANLEEACTWWIDTLNYDWSQNHATPMINYLKSTNQTPNDIQFYLLKPLKNDQNLEKKWQNYTKKLNLLDITFDKLIYNV